LEKEMISKYFDKEGSWKTTTSAVVATVGMTLSGYPGAVGIVGKVFQDVGILVIGLFARDNAKSSEKVGAE
jgi:hypothetical protein